MEIYLIRHTRPDIEKGVCYGQSDIGLAASFEEEKKVVFRQLPSSFDLIFTSPLSRCSSLAACLKAHRHVTDERLKELNFGEWEMKAWQSIPRAELDEWGNSYLRAQVPGGESYPDLKKRLLAFWQELRALESIERIAIISHKGVIQTLLYFEGLLEEKELFVQELPYGAVVRISLQGKSEH